MEDALIGITPDLASHQADVFDEFECLNLNITTPANAHSGSNLPVLLYIHGGGGHSGSNSDWWNIGTSLVKQSIVLRKPVVSVAIKYV
jgi:carboxylesterase type B